MEKFEALPSTSPSGTASISSPKVVRIYVLGVITGILFSVFLGASSNLQAIQKEFVSRPRMLSPMMSATSGSSGAADRFSQGDAFGKIVENAYQYMIEEEEVNRNVNVGRSTLFDLETWNKTTNGGLVSEDRLLLAKIYSQAGSVFEYGLGESTYIADHVGVPRYAGIDSDPVWVAMARDEVADHYRFSLADIGPTRAWGFPDKRLPKQMFAYQLAPLVVEPLPFDVYMVDGRFRLPCVLASFLHASSRGADSSQTKVLLHDCPKDAKSQPPKRRHYHGASHLLDLVDHSGQNLCVFQRKPETTDEQLMELWFDQKMEIDR